MTSLSTTEPTTAEKIRKLPWSIGHNAANTIFIQLTFLGSVFVLFLDTLGLDKTQIGFLLSLIPFADTISLFIAPMVARNGYKRTHLTALGTRTIITAFLLLTPWVLATFGASTTLYFVTGVVALFALTRSVGITAVYPWIQEYVPNSVRGKYSATNNLFSTLTGFTTVGIAGFVLGRVTGLTGFMVLIGTGVMFGFVSVWATSHIPGGAPVKTTQTVRAAIKALAGAVRDKDLWLYLFGAGCLILAIVPLNSFIALFMQEQVGLSSSNVVWIQTGVLLGGLLSTYLWGWTADRYGSRPIMLTGAALRVLLPILWMLMPRQHSLSLTMALGIAVIQGISDMGWTIGSTRLLYISIVPTDKKSEYMAIYAAWVGAVSGLSQLLGGLIVERSAGISGQFFIFTLDPYIGLFGLGLILPIVGVWLLRDVRADSTVTVEQFAGMFLRGNPLLAMTTLVEYHLLGKEEETVVHLTERLGQAKSPLTGDELLEALTDPRFNVRFEAIISIARTRRDPRLTEALINILNGTELALSVVAAWALGRIGDPDAREALRAGLDSKYHSIQAHCARALGTLGDEAIGPLLLGRLAQETDKGLQMAYASALGKLQTSQASQPLLALLRVTENEGARLELALALARLVGGEGHFIRLVRETRHDTGTALSQAISGWKRKVAKDLPAHKDLLVALDTCADTLARGALAQGVALLSQILHRVPGDHYSDAAVIILADCIEQLDLFKDTRREYVLLALHVLDVEWQNNT